MAVIQPGAPTSEDAPMRVSVGIETSLLYNKVDTEHLVALVKIASLWVWAGHTTLVMISNTVWLSAVVLLL